MRYALASLFSLLVVGVASGVPDHQAATARRLPDAPAECPTASGRDDLFFEAAVEPNDVRAEAEAVLLDLAACMNTGERNRVLPLFTDDARQETIATMASAPTPRSSHGDPDPPLPPAPIADRIAVVWIGEPWPMPDGRLAVPTIMRPGALAEARSLVILDRQDGRFRIDEIVAVDPGGRLPAAAAIRNR